MDKFAGLRSKPPALAIVAGAPPPREGVRPSRVGKKALGAHFSPELSRALRILAVDEETSVQALVGEAIDLLMRDRGKHPFSER